MKVYNNEEALDKFIQKMIESANNIGKYICFLLSYTFLFKDQNNILVPGF